jgi:hypothetical protein
MIPVGQTKPPVSPFLRFVHPMVYTTLLPDLFLSGYWRVYCCVAQFLCATHASKF